MYSQQIKIEGGSPAYEITYKKQDSKTTGTREYDIVVMATPLNVVYKYKVICEHFTVFTSYLYITEVILRGALVV